MRPQAPSLDIIAAQAGGSEDQQDSRSSSSTNSPAPAEYEESDFYHGANDSQSSLGITNFQDMRVADDECQPPINRLPNEILISIFSKLSSPSDQLHCMLTCKRWARNAVDLLWHRPACTTWNKHSSICQTLGMDNPYFAYREFIKRLNLAALADRVNDGSVTPLAVCTRVERLTLTGCQGLTDSGLTALVKNGGHLLALDISGDQQITELSINAVAENCRKLQGLNISGCTRISNESLVKLGENCKYIKRLKLNDCNQLLDSSILAFAQNCPNILEIDLHQCRQVGNEPITALLSNGQSLRELRLAGCELIDDGAFLSLPSSQSYEHLRILDLTSCARLTDRAVEKIIDAAPRLRNLVLAKCRLITDVAVHAISKLGKNLHYVHLGHCGQITDVSVKRLVQSCNRIRYIDLGCCTHLTDDSVTKLATLPKLKRIGLVKCGAITDDSVYALARANHRPRTRRDARGNISVDEVGYSSLERVHLSYCLNLSLKSILKLLNSCPRLTHLSLTGVQAFLRDDLETFCRDAPPEFTDHQRNVFCVFSGQGVSGLRNYLNTNPAFAEIRDPTNIGSRSRISAPVLGGGGGRAAGGGALLVSALAVDLAAESQAAPAAGGGGRAGATAAMNDGLFDDRDSPDGMMDDEMDAFDADADLAGLDMVPTLTPVPPPPPPILGVAGIGAVFGLPFLDPGVPGTPTPIFPQVRASPVTPLFIQATEAPGPSQARSPSPNAATSPTTTPRPPALYQQQRLPSSTASTRLSDGLGLGIGMSTPTPTTSGTTLAEAIAGASTASMHGHRPISGVPMEDIDAPQQRPRHLFTDPADVDADEEDDDDDEETVR